VTPPIAGGGAFRCFASNQTGYCSASDPTFGDDCECFNKGQDEDQRCQVSKRHKIILNEQDTSTHQCGLIIESASKTDSGLFKFYSNYGELISECDLVVNETPNDQKLAFLNVQAATITVLLVAVVILSSVIIVIVRGQANHQHQPQQDPGPDLVVQISSPQSPALQSAPASAPSSEIELPLLSKQDDARQVVNTGSNNDDDPARTCQAV